MGSYIPPYTTNDQMLRLAMEIGELIGTLSAIGGMRANPWLRRDNRIRTIHASLAIENNSLSIDQVTAIIHGKRVLGSPLEIQEVKNAYEVYEHLLELDPYSTENLLYAHRVLMSGLTAEAGVFRSGGVGIFAGDRLIHMAPPAARVPEQIADLMHWAQTADTHPLIVSSVFHYEFEFIHPFTDGNGRMGRMWQTLLLCQWKPVFAWLPVETLIRERQDAYYKVLAESDRQANSEPFITFMLTAIRDALRELTATEQVAEQVSDQVKSLLSALGNDTLSAVELMSRLNLRHRPSFYKSYLRPAMEAGFLERTLPGKPNSSKQKYRRVR